MSCGPNDGGTGLLDAALVPPASAGTRQRPLCVFFPLWLSTQAATCTALRCAAEMRNRLGKYISVPFLPL